MSAEFHGSIVFSIVISLHFCQHDSSSLAEILHDNL